MERSQSLDRPRRISFLTLALIAAALYFGRDVLIPLALAILITFILTRWSSGSRRCGWGECRRPCWWSSWCSEGSRRWRGRWDGNS